MTIPKSDRKDQLKKDIKKLDDFLDVLNEAERTRQIKDIRTNLIPNKSDEQSN